ncbi:MAG: DUF1801 domain-containing protein [Rhizobiaceae bacterium]|nr:DUF1801 domain-containing protein [Rhizobiaceae bacterium]
MGTPFKDPNIEKIFNAYPAPVREKLLALRELIFSAGERAEGAGVIQETLKWGQPSYVTVRPKSGSTIRIDATGDAPFDYAAYFICTTTLVEEFRELYPNDFTFKANRTLLFKSNDEVPEEALSHCLSIALTYHSRKLRKAI